MKLKKKKKKREKKKNLFIINSGTAKAKYFIPFETSKLEVYFKIMIEN